MFNKAKKAAAKAKKVAAKAAAKAAKEAATKKVAVKKVVRPEAPKAPAAPVVPVPPKPVAKKPVKPADIVKVHVLGNAMIDGKQYVVGWEGSVSGATYRALGTSCVSMAKWRIMQEKGGLSSLRK